MAELGQLKCSMYRNVDLSNKETISLHTIKESVTKQNFFKPTTYIFDEGQ